MQPNSAEPVSDPVILSSSSDEEESNNTISNDKQIVLYDPTSNGSELNPDPIQCKPPLTKQKVLPSVGTFTVQCAECFKWRLIPTKEKYEELRERILEQPFRCEIAKEWRPEICCDDPTDIEQDGSRLWAIDKPNIAQPPPGWERELRIRGEGGSKFADVYYISPSGKRLRSMVEVQKYLFEHPEYVRQGVTLSQFSFQTPKPLQENYVRKRTARPEANFGMSKHLEPKQVKPLSWAPCDDPTILKLGQSAFPDSYSRDPLLETPPAKKKARPSTEHLYNSDKVHTPQRFKIKGPRLPPNGIYD